MSKRIAYASMLLAIGMIFSYIESIIPIQIGIPGVKLGLANLVILTGLYYLDTLQILLILTSRIILSGFMFGNLFSIIYSLSGGLLSFLIMYLVKNKLGLSMLNVSMIGGISHNIGQILVAIVVVKTIAIAYYLPILIVSGFCSGLIVGIIGKRIRVLLLKVSENSV